MVAFLYIVYTLIAYMAVLLVIACILVAAFMLLRRITVALYRKYRAKPPIEPQPHYFILPDGRKRLSPVILPPTNSLKEALINSACVS